MVSDHDKIIPCHFFLEEQGAWAILEVTIVRGNHMEDIEKLIKTSMVEIERMLNTKTVVGEPLILEGNTLVPLVSVGFGFGAGGGTCKAKPGEEGGGAGGGGGIKPVALVIVNKEGVRVETVKGAASSALEKIAEAVGKATCKGH